MAYSDRIDEELKEIYSSNPKIKEIMRELDRIDAIHLMEFDTMNEREYQKVLVIKNILEKNLSDTSQNR